YATARAIRDGLAPGEASVATETATQPSGVPQTDPPPLMTADERVEMLEDVAEAARASGQPTGVPDADHALLLLEACSFTAAEAEARLAVLALRAQRLAESNQVYWHQVSA